MRHRLIIIAIATFFSQFTFGQELKKEYQEGIVHLIDCLKKNKKEQIAEMISYPLAREYPVPSIKNKQDFILRFNEIFDDTLKRLIITSKPATDWSEMGWRGIMLFQGDVWMDFEGRLIAINYQSKTEKEIKERLIATEKSKLHFSLVNFKKPVYILETAKFRIRIDDLSENNYRYASWPISKSMSEKPDLVLNNGQLIFDGSGGNHRIEFKNAGYVYECSIIVLGEDDSPPAMLTIYKGDKAILSQKAKIVQK
jgi:hypothetical protein